MEVGVRWLVCGALLAVVVLILNVVVVLGNLARLEDSRQREG